MKILRNKSFSDPDKKEKKKKKKRNSAIGATTGLGAVIGSQVGLIRGEKDYDKRYNEVVSEYEKALEQRAKEIKAKGFDPAKVEVAKSLKFLTDADKLSKLAAKEGNKAWAKTTLKATGIGAATGLGLGVANHVIAKNKNKKEKK